MEKAKQIRGKWLTIRLSEGEENKLKKIFERTTSRSLSEYAREVLLKEPVTVFYRNQSADDFLAEMIQLKREFNSIGNNFNQVVHKLHTLDYVAQIKVWTVAAEATYNTLLQKVDEIKVKMNEIHLLWSQK